MRSHPDFSILDSYLTSTLLLFRNPNESGDSFELVKIFSENVQIGIKLDMKENYLYVATLHTITNGKLKHGIDNGRLKKFDK